MNSQHINTLIKSTKLLVTDCDGVLTDGKLSYSQNNDELRTFSIYDGSALKILKALGYRIVIASTDRTSICSRRAVHLGVNYIDASTTDKYLALSRNIAPLPPYIFVGDDIGDLSCIQHSALSFCPSSAPKYIKDIVDCILPVKGGEGVLLELANLLLNADGLNFSDIRHQFFRL